MVKNDEKKIQRLFRGFFSKLNRNRVVQEHRRRNSLQSCSIIASNCIGGILAHDLGLRFDSPTVNLWFEAEGFVSFVEKLLQNIRCPLSEVYMDESCGYPVGQLGDVKIFSSIIRRWKRLRISGRFDASGLILTTCV